MINSGLFYLIDTILLFLGILLYLRLAEKYRIEDKPNERSSHVLPTVRGGGILFVLAMVILAFQQEFNQPYFLIGFFAVSTISFLDDIKEVSKRWRLGIQILSILLLIYQITQGNLIWWQWPVILIFIMSLINFYNFMDGINGITALYSLVLFGTYLYLNQTGVMLVPEELIIVPIIAIIIFSFLNVRTKARCFAGDVGSVSLAFLGIYLLFWLSWQEQNYLYIWLVGVYGVDAVLTIFQRLIMGQNILQGHRLHLYQLLANEGGLPHVLVSVLFALLQILLNIFLLTYIIPGQFDPVIVNIVMSIFFVSIYVPVKYSYSKLLNRKANNTDSDRQAVSV
jgi:UDP-GlcNAc:undecaprenyl-phosphate GlcNAc-1-phosphate transferase